ncbi:MAG: family 10 glycosylhydrolase [Bacteroidetes bacterium]|nr:family 10 glycosylhydrolase [Bacteroidota bacterium]
MKKYKLFIIALCCYLSVNAQKTIPNNIKGVWLTNVASEVLNSRKNIKEAVEVCKQSGINTIFVVTWNRSRTLYPSNVMNKEFGIPIMEKYQGRDPLKEVIEEAHTKGIKVYAWFEFGFSCSYKENGGIIIQKHPDWAAINKEGKLVSKNDFEWMNAFDPHVQDFMMSIITEVVKKYNIDGIQGDDRLPALPSEAGYDKYTVSQYKIEHHDSLPPLDNKDAKWLTWRANRLNKFMERIHYEVTTLKPSLIISMAPSIFPWSKQEYLQDWPTWVKNDWVDFICPQVYRYDFDKYKVLMNETMEQIPLAKRDKVFPGILLQVDDYNPSVTFLSQMIEQNRKLGVKGEVFFFYEGLKKNPDYFKGYAKMK